VRAPKVLDSLAAAKYDSAALATVRQLLAPPTGGMAAFGGRGGGGGGRGATGACERPMTQWEPFCARPAEAAPARGGGGGGAQAQQLAERLQQATAAAGTPAVRKVFELIGLPAPAQGGRGGGGFGGFGGGSTATTGDYGVVLQVGNTVLKSRLRVENVGGARSGTATTPEEDEGRR
jgi:hypothetical protein